MTLLSEGEVYVGAKRLLESQGWTLLAGQPPNGRDHLPVVEIKWTGREGIGSEGALRPDLVAVRGEVLLVVECKPTHDAADAGKLRRVLGSEDRRRLLVEELRQRHLFERRGFQRRAAWEDRVAGGLSHSGSVRRLPDLWVIAVRSAAGDGQVHPPAGG